MLFHMGLFVSVCLYGTIGQLGQFGVRDKWARCVARDSFQC